jgi:valine dehydrogenase (NAD+)
MTIATQPVSTPIPPGHEQPARPDSSGSVPGREQPARPDASGSFLSDADHEQVVIRQDPETGLRFIVAVHSTVLGPSLGGMRLKRYPGGLREALEDVMGLARTMTLKASAAGLDLGGGKSVMIDDGRTEMRRARLEGAARTIESLDGAYITAEDIGTTCEDMDYVARFTRFCVGRSRENGGRGDPSPITAETVFQAMRRGLEAHDGSSELDGRRVGVVGLGKVGGRLAARLSDAGARVVACDLDDGRCEEFAAERGAEIAPSAEAILGRELDVLAPCAAGGMIDDALARSLDVSVVAGAANNPLTSPEVARTLLERGILYVPDFLANCGGLIHVSGEWYAGAGPSEDERIARAMDRLDQAIAAAAAEGSTPLEVAERQALERVEAARR